MSSYGRPREIGRTWLNFARSCKSNEHFVSTGKLGLQKNQTEARKRRGGRPLFRIPVVFTMDGHDLAGTIIACEPDSGFAPGVKEAVLQHQAIEIGITDPANTFAGIVIITRH